MNIRDVGLGIVRRLPWVESVARKIYASLPSALHDTPTSQAKSFFAMEPAVSFVEIGAFDGIAGDPVRSLVLGNPGWIGVLVEPQPDVFARLRDNYAGEAHRLHFLNCAISTASGERAFYFIPQEERERLALPDWGGEVASFDEGHLRRHCPTARVEQRNVKTITFAEAAALLPDARVDLVAMDVEGHERAIIESIDFDRHRVRFVIYEHKHMSSAEAAHVQSWLRQHGFEIKPFGRDTIARRPLPASLEARAAHDQSDRRDCRNMK